jgi:hypothetical protein
MSPASRDRMLKLALAQVAEDLEQGKPSATQK